MCCMYMNAQVCEPTTVHMETRTRHWVISIALCCVSLRLRLSLSQKHIIWVRPAGRWVLSIHLSLPSKCITMPGFSCRCWGIRASPQTQESEFFRRFPCRWSLGDEMRRWSSLQLSNLGKVCLCGISGVCPWGDICLQEPSMLTRPLCLCSSWEVWLPTAMR